MGGFLAASIVSIGRRSRRERGGGVDMKIVVLGAGAMGGLYGSYLRRENDVTMVDINAPVVDKIKIGRAHV